MITIKLAFTLQSDKHEQVQLMICLISVGGSSYSLTDPLYYMTHTTHQPQTLFYQA